MNQDKAFFGSVGAGLIAAAIGTAIAFVLTGCITPGIEFRSAYGNLRYDGKTVSYEMPSDPGLRK